MLCRCIHLTTYRYVWRKDGAILESTSSLQIRQVDEGSTVYIENPTSRHEGFYQCFASNVFGTAVTVKALLRKAGQHIAIITMSLSDNVVRSVSVP